VEMLPRIPQQKAVRVPVLAAGRLSISSRSSFTRSDNEKFKEKSDVGLRGINPAGVNGDAKGGGPVLV
jgi:hypothetical protein